MAYMNQNAQQIAKRDGSVDLLRVIGLALVIAAHCGFPQWFNELREFDVVLLMFLSGMSFLLSASSSGSWIAYAKKRFFRLVVPVWIFLTLFFLFFRLAGRSFSLSVIAQSYLFLSGGILFVWIYRIYFSVALVNPFLKQIRERISFRWLMIGIAVVLLLNDLLSELFLARLVTIGKVLELAVTYTVAYAAVSLAGMEFHKAERKQRLVMTGLFGACFVLSGIFFRFPSFYAFKYPPRLYYASYGLLWSCLLYLLLSQVPDAGRNLMCGKGIQWLSAQTMNIYMWHIFIFYVLDTFVPSLLEGHPWLDFGLLYFGSLLFAFLQSRVQRLAGKQNT